MSRRSRPYVTTPQHTRTYRHAHRHRADAAMRDVSAAMRLLRLMLLLCYAKAIIDTRCRYATMSPFHAICYAFIFAAMPLLR